MKSVLTILAALFVSVSALAQGEINFANTASTLISTNSYTASGPMSGVNAYRIGLYVGDFGTAEGSLTLVGLATNGITPGRFSGNPFAGFFPVPGHGAGDRITFQVRAWSLNAGASWAEAVSDSAYHFRGVSQLGNCYLGTPTSIAGEIFGTDSTPDQFGQIRVPGFTMFAVPEPGTWALLGLGSALLWCATQRRRK